MIDRIKALFDLGYTKKDAVRAAWAFVAAFGVAVQGKPASKAAAYAGIVAGVLAVKNFVLAGGALKG